MFSPIFSMFIFTFLYESKNSHQFQRNAQEILPLDEFSPEYCGVLAQGGIFLTATTCREDVTVIQGNTYYIVPQLHLAKWYKLYNIDINLKKHHQPLPQPAIYIQHLHLQCFIISNRERLGFLIDDMHLLIKKF